MSIQWSDLRFLLAVGRAGSLSAAARTLGVNKATVSRRIAALEEELGATLLARGSGGYALTGAGHVALAAAEQLDQLCAWWPTGSPSSSYATRWRCEVCGKHPLPRRNEPRCQLS